MMNLITFERGIDSSLIASFDCLPDFFGEFVLLVDELFGFVLFVFVAILCS